MANSYIEYSTAGTGTNGLGQATFSYNELDVISGDDIYCQLFNASSEWEVAPINSRDTSAKTITLSSTPAGGTYKVRVYRQTTSDALVDFVDGARLTESDLDTAYKQGLFVAQEVSEDAAAIGSTSTNNLSLSGTTTVADLTATGTVVIPSGTDATHFYREGSYTAVMTCGTSGTISLNGSYNTAYYTKIGKLITVSADLRVTSVSSPTGAIYISLPFAVAGTARYVAPTITHGVPKQSNQLGAFFLQAVEATSTAIISYNKDNSTNASLSGVIDASDEFKFTLVYQTA